DPAARADRGLRPHCGARPEDAAGADDRGGMHARLGGPGRRERRGDAGVGHVRLRGHEARDRALAPVALLEDDGCGAGRAELPAEGGIREEADGVRARTRERAHAADGDLAVAVELTAESLGELAQGDRHERERGASPAAGRCQRLLEALPARRSEASTCEVMSMSSLEYTASATTRS